MKDFTEWSNQEWSKVISDTYEGAGAVSKSTADYLFPDRDFNTMSRMYGRNDAGIDYTLYNGGQSVYDTDAPVIRASMRAYEKVSIIRSFIDLMSDFTIRGIRIAHPNPKIQNFLDSWAKCINFKVVSERIANMLYRAANCPVKRRFGKVPVYFEDEWRKAFSAMNDNQDDIVLQKQPTRYRSIPLNYTILDPLSIEVVGGEISAFIGKPLYALKISEHFKQVLINVERKAIRNNQLKEMLRSIPDELRAAIRGYKAVIPLDPDKLAMLFYKKDDFKIWAVPILASILDAIVLLNKMHLCDAAALDGAMSQVRLWTLGNLEFKVMPTKWQLNYLRNILANVGQGKTLDLVWGPDLDFKESNSQVHHFLTAEKYHQVMTEIYAGLGVPQALTGSSKGGEGGFTNNAISMRTFVERLESGRDVIRAFWEGELKRLQKAMGWRFCPLIMFDGQALDDKATRLTMITNMWDRSLISDERFLQICEEEPELEAIRIKRETKKRSVGNKPPKASPFHNPEQDHDLKKIALQSGNVAPSEVGLDLEDRKDGEQSPNEMNQQNQMDMAKMQNDNQTEMTKTQNKHQMAINQDNNKTKTKIAKFKPKGVSGQGRPKTKKDGQKRKQRTAKPKTGVKAFYNLFSWSTNAQKAVAEMVNPAILAHFNKKNMRSLTKEEVEYAEDMKLIVFANLQPYSDVEPEIVYNILSDSPRHNAYIKQECARLAAEFNTQYSRVPTLEEMREIQSMAYAAVNGEYNDVED